MNKKYKFTGETFQHEGVTLRRIQALRSFGEVEEGDIGGWIEKESNLSHEGDCWVGDEAKVYDAAMVHGDAQVYEHASVHEEALISGDASVFGEAEVYGEACVFGDAKVCGEAYLYDGQLYRGVMSKKVPTVWEEV
jgi:carbonic anhydrase/acetyltransferase-like protein (isoleucine patch superfamily)